MTSKEHDLDCPLYPQHWLRHAVAAVQAVVDGSADAGTDRLSAAALLNALEHFTGHAGWESVTLPDVAQYATLLNADQFPPCDCTGPSRLRW